MSTLVASNLQASGGGGTAAKLASINDGPLAGFRNAIINGGMEIVQRGTSFASPASTAYTLDRWLLIYDGAGATRTISQQAFAAGSTEAFPGAANFMRFAQTVAGSGATYNALSQRIENVRVFAGQTVTISFWARAAASLTMPQIQLRQNFGSGGSAYVDTTTALNAAITTTWTQYSYTVALPSISGKTIGTSSFLELLIFLPINTTFTFEITGVQVEVGTVASPFERRFASVELALCQRYYEAQSSTELIMWPPIDSAGNNGARRLWAPFVVTKRAAPTITLTASQGLTSVSTASYVNGFRHAGTQGAFLETAVTSWTASIEL